jgi:hypothetical protein
MSVSGILSSAVFGIGANLFQNRMQKVQSEFQQLGKDLQSGNLSAAQTDFATLQQLGPQTTSSSSTQSTSTLTQDFNQLGADLKAGNTTAAQQDFAKIQQDFQSQATQAHHHHHHHNQGGSTDGSSEISQLFSQLGQALQSGSLSTAQQAYAALQQDFQQYAQTNALPGSSSSGTVSVSA